MALPKAISQQTELGLWEAGESVNSVLYVDGEMPLELTQFRNRALNIEKGAVTYLHHDQVFTMLGTSLNIGESSHRDAITSLLVSKGFKVMMLDNLSSLASGIDENKGDEYEPIAHWLLELRRRKITVIVIHHAGRNGLMRGHSKREDACSWILSLRDAKEDGDEGAKFISHFDKPSRNTGDSLPDLLWHFTTGADKQAQVRCELATSIEYEAFIQHVISGVDKQTEIAELMGKHRGTISRWAKDAVNEGRIIRSGHSLKPTGTVPDSPSTKQDAWD
jgi:putative DNA primase/helicase